MKTFGLVLLFLVLYFQVPACHHATNAAVSEVSIGCIRLLHGVLR